MAEEKKNFDLEAVYDEKIFPLMAQIIEICQEHKMPMVASFQLSSDVEGIGDGESLHCTSKVFPDERDISDELEEASRALFPRRRSGLMAFTISTPKEGDQ